MSRSASSTIGRVALAVAAVELTGLVFIAIFYASMDTVDGPFGTLNDLCVALGGILSGVLAWMLYRTHHTYAARAGDAARALALAGAMIAPLGSLLVIADITGWFLAGLVTTFGYALIGLWLLLVNISALSWTAYPRRLAIFGLVAGACMAIGLLAGPGILARVDSTDSAAWYVLAGLYLGGLGWNILYSAWCIWFGRLSMSPAFSLAGTASTKRTA
jgi:hypothetical protein